MVQSTFLKSRTRSLGAVLAAFSVFWALPAKGQLTPKSPEVKQAVAKAVQVLESSEAKDDRLGAYALVGMVMLKSDAPASHPKVLEAAQRIQLAVRGGANPESFGDMGVYSIGLCAIFLCTLDPVKYGSEINALLKTLQAAQKPHGGWGYLHSRQTGDTSMTQYGVLAMWEARQVGFDTPPSMLDGVTDWLLRTQDPSGAYGYQGTVSSSYVPVPQSEVRLGVGIAGLGSLYMCANLLGADERVKAEEDKLPPALKEVKRGAAQARRNRFDQRLFREAKSRGNRWFETNFKVDSGFFPYYYLYAVERYWSIREFVEGETSESPSWYQESARWLLNTQKPNGSWWDQRVPASQAGAVPDTAFGALFLLRSMKKSIERAQSFGRGVLVGGRGLPKGTADVTLRDGQVVAKPLAGPAEQLLSAIGNAEDPEHAQAAEAMANLPIVDARKLVSAHEEKLRQLVSDGTPEARRAAVQALARSHDMDNIPLLIYAMSDPDPDVVLAAHDGLRRMSRRLDAFGLPDPFTETDVLRVIERWKDWYRTIRPDAEFED